MIQLKEGRCIKGNILLNWQWKAYCSKKFYKSFDSFLIKLYLNFSTETN